VTKPPVGPRLGRLGDAAAADMSMAVGASLQPVPGVRGSIAALRAELRRARGQLGASGLGDFDSGASYVGMAGREEPLDMAAASATFGGCAAFSARSASSRLFAGMAAGEDFPEVGEEPPDEQTEQSFDYDADGAATGAAAGVSGFEEGEEEEEEEEMLYSGLPCAGYAAASTGRPPSAMRRRPTAQAAPLPDIPPSPSMGACPSSATAPRGTCARGRVLGEPRAASCGRRSERKSSKTPLPRPATQEREAMAKAKSLTRLALEESAETQKEISRIFEATQFRARDLGKATGEARAKLRSCVAASGRSAARVQSLEMTISEVEDGLSRLQHVRYARWAEQAVCERRLEILERRPLQDSASKDDLLEAASAEWQVLAEARQVLLDKEFELQHILEELDEARKGMLAETATRRSACRVDQAAFRSSVAAAPAAGTAGATPAQAARLGRAMDKLDQGLGWAPEEDADYSVRLVGHIQRDAAKLWRSCEAVMDYVMQACAAAGEQTRVCIAKAATDKVEVRRSLDEQIKKVEYAMSAAAMSLSRMTRWQDSFGKGFTPDKIERAASLVAELKRSRRKLQELIQRSLHALQAIDACKRRCGRPRGGDGGRRHGGAGRRCRCPLDAACGAVGRPPSHSRRLWDLWRRRCLGCCCQQRAQQG